MSGEIVNRVANSKLITFDLEDFFPEGERRLLDISDWLFEGFILKEKEFRESVKQHQWAVPVDLTDYQEPLPVPCCVEIRPE